MKDCKACNHTNAASSRYCDQCGAKLQEIEAPAPLTPEVFAGIRLQDAQPTNRFGEPIGEAPITLWETLDGKTRTLLGLAVIAVVGIVIVNHSLSGTNYSSSKGETSLPRPSSAPVMTSHYAAALALGANSNFEEAIRELYLVPKKHKDFKLAQAKIKEYKSKFIIARRAEEHRAAEAERLRLVNEEQQRRVSNPELFVKVLDGWKWTYDEYGYDYVKGSVNNDSGKTVRYWAATVRFFDASDREIDSAYTNSAQPLYSGSSKRFEIMHSHIPCKYARMEMTDIRFED